MSTAARVQIATVTGLLVLLLAGLLCQLYVPGVTPWESLQVAGMAFVLAEVFLVTKLDVSPVAVVALSARVLGLSVVACVTVAFAALYGAWRLLSGTSKGVLT